MTRWNWKRWAFAIVSGTVMAGSFAALASDDMPKAGESITLKYPGQPDRVVMVVKSVRKPDGSLETEVKDGKSGETFTLVDPAPENKIPSVSPAKPNPLPPLPQPVVAVQPARPVAPPAQLPVIANKPASPVRPAPVNTFADVPVRSPVAGQTPMPPMAESKDKRRLFNRDPEGLATVPAAQPVEDKRPGILGRVFGKKSVPPAMPATSMPLAPTARTNAEPPRVQPAKPVLPPPAPNRIDRVAPPTPVVPPVAAPTAPSSIPVPVPSKPVAPVIVVPSKPVAPVIVEPSKPVPPVIVEPSKPVAPVIVEPSKPIQPVVITPAPVESIPVPPPPAKPTLPPIAVPSIPAPVPVPTIPSVPLSSVPVEPAIDVRPAPVVPVPVQPASVKPAAMDTDSLIGTLKDAPAPSARLRAVKQLSTGPQASSEAVKSALFHTAKTDVCAAVKADCIEALAKLDHRDPAFIAFVKTACSDDSGEVRLAAKTALEKIGK